MSSGTKERRKEKPMPDCYRRGQNAAYTHMASRLYHEAKTLVKAGDHEGAERMRAMAKWATTHAIEVQEETEWTR